MKELQSTTTDLRGAYSFSDLAPGSYRVLATFEYRSPDTEAMDAAGPAFQIEAHARVQRNLTLYLIR
jgi:hypothetical protein